MSYLEPGWVDFNHRRFRAVPDAAYKWLKDESSLTQRVIAFCQGQFRVRLLQQQWCNPLVSEARFLSVKNTELSMIREVELLCNATPLVFARTIIPGSSFTGKARQLSCLGEKPLGAVLFSDPTTVRNKIQVARLLPRHALYNSAVAHIESKPDELWGRRTLFEFAGKPLLVNEIFLPEIIT